MASSNREIKTHELRRMEKAHVASDLRVEKSRKSDEKSPHRKEGVLQGETDWEREGSVYLLILHSGWGKGKSYWSDH